MQHCYILNRYKFPLQDATNVNTFVDKRSPAEIYQDIILYLNEKLSPDLVKIWSEFLGRDVTDTCFYRSGLSYLAEDMKRVRKEYAYNKEINIDNESHMPDHMKRKEHSKHCKPINGNCSYLTEINNLLSNTNLTKDNFISLMKNKQNVKLLLNHLLTQEMPKRCKKKINYLFKLNQSRNGLLNSTFKKYILNLARKYGDIKIQNPEDCKEIYISNFMSKELHSFVKGFIAKDLKQSLNQEQSMSRFLVDSGSTSNLLNYSTFKNMKFNDSDIIKCGEISLKGSSGLKKDTFLGYINKNLYLQAENGKYFNKKQIFYILKENIDIPNILGQPFLSNCSINMQYSKNNLKISASMNNTSKMEEVIYLKLAKQESINTCNFAAVQPGDTFATFYLKNSNINSLGECKIKSNKLDFLPVDFGALGNYLVTDQGIFSQISDDIISLPLATPAKELIPENQCEVEIHSCYFVSKEVEELFLCGQRKNPVGKFQDVLPRSEATPENPGRGQEGEKDAGQEKKPDLKEFLLQMSQGKFNDQESWDRCQQNLFATQDTEVGNDQGNTSLSQNIKEVYASEVIEEKNEEDVLDIISFLTSTHGDEEEELIIKDEQEFISPSKRMFVDNDCNPETGLKIPEQLLKHLNKEDRKEVLDIIKKYPNVWAKDKFSIGHFSGFKAQIPTKPGMTAVQKERRQPSSMIDKVDATMQGLFNAGVFGLSTGDHDRYLANTNIVPKLETTEQIQLNSKADKYIARVAPEEDRRTNLASGFRAAIDYKRLNEITEDIGKIQLPTLKEVEESVRGSLVSTVDLKNQYYAVDIEPEHQSKTNFYYKNAIWMSKKLAMGLANAPFIAFMAMKFSFRDEMLKQFLEINKITDFPYKSFDSYLKIYLDDILCHTPRKPVCKHYTAKQLHFICLQSILFALKENGWIASLNKCNFLKDEVTFLGQVINCKKDTSRMSSARVRAIQDWRNPKSFGELNSRLAVLSYFSKYIIGYRLIALPLIQCLKQEVFEWTPSCQIAYNNLKFLISLNISLAHFDPDLILLCTSDSSQVSMNAAYFMFNPDTLELRLMDTQTRLFSKSQINYAPVQREATSLMFCVSHGEAYIRNCCTETWLLCDASSLQYISRNKSYSSRQYNDALFLSTLPKLNIFYCSGKALLLSDILSRQYQDVVLSKNFQLSAELAKMVPPLNQLEIPNLTKLSSELLTDYILENPRAEIIDTYPKRFLYHQNIRKTHFHSMTSNISSEIQFLLGLALGFNNESVLSMPVWQDILKSKGQVTKSLSEHVIKSHNLSRLHQKICDMNFSKKVIDSLLERYNVVNKTSVSKESCYYVKSTVASECQCQECVLMLDRVQLDTGALQLVTKNMCQINAFLESASGILGLVCHNMYKSFQQKLNDCTCISAKNLMTVLFFKELLHRLTDAEFSFNKKTTTTVCFIPYFISDLFTLKITDANKLALITKESFEINEMASMCLDLNLILGYKGRVTDVIFKNKNLILLNAPAMQGILYHLEKLTIFNCNEQPLCFAQNQEICTFQLEAACEHLVLTKVENKDLLNISLYQSQKTEYETFHNLCQVLNANVCYWLNAQTENQSKSLSKQQKLNEDYEVKTRALKHGISMEEAKKSGNWNKDSINQRKIISSILLGQTLLRNQNIFSDRLLAELQSKDILLNKEIEKCNSGASKDFFLKNGVLYKKCSIGPNIESMKLCLPKLIAKELLWRLHVNKHLHISNSQLIHIYSQNFFTPDIGQIAKLVRAGCTVCMLCKNNYKNKFSGQHRENLNLAVGECYVFDTAYLPRDKHGYKYLLLMSERLTGYTIGQPLKSLNSENTAKALQQFLLHLPAPKEISCDGGTEFSGEFEKKCQEMDIFIKTKLPRRSQSQGQAEQCIRDMKALLTRIASSFPEGRSRWSNFLPLVLQNMNVRHPYRQGLSRRNLMFSPFFYNLLNLTIATENENIHFDPKLIELQKKSHNFLENKRREALLKLYQKSTKPFELKIGQILTNNAATSELPTVNDSKALQPNTLKLYKVIDVHKGNMGALCINLHTGKVKTHQISNLRKIGLDDMLKLTAIDPTYSFKNQLKNARIRNLHGKAIDDYEGLDYEVSADNDDGKKTRSGKVYATELVSILRRKVHEIPDLSCQEVSQRRATVRGMTLAKSLGYEVKKEGMKAKIPSSKSLSVYNGEDKKQGKRKASHKRNVTFSNELKIRKNGVDSVENVIFERKFNYKCFLAFLMDPIFDFSAKEIQMLK